jgi:hypothetical protein
VNTDQPRPVTDLSAADWVVAGIGPFGTGVGSLVPHGFEAYARILHPAESAGGRPVTWAEVADWSGRTMHSKAQFAALTRPVREDGPAPWDDEPHTGELSMPLLTALCEVLAEHTGTPQRCWFSLWDGWNSSAPSPVGPRLRLPQREYLLFEAALFEVGDMPRQPNLFWPDDRSWCVATEIDLDSTYLGGSAALVTQLLDDSRLEVWPVAVTDQVTADSDHVNGR